MGSVSMLPVKSEEWPIPADIYIEGLCLANEN